jgi:hypothetical protein
LIEDFREARRAVLKAVDAAVVAFTPTIVYD